MKLLIGLVILWTAFTATAQYIDTFSESNRVYNVLTGLPVEASEGLVASLYWAPDEATHESQLTPLGSVIPVGLDGSGVFFNYPVAPPVDIIEQRIHVQVRVWELRFGNTYEQAEANRTPQDGRLALVGRSRIVANVRLRQNFNTPLFGPILVRPVSTENQCAQAVPGSFPTPANQPVNIALLGSDTGRTPLTYQITTLPAQGTLTGTPPNLTYTSQSGFCGRDTFSFAVTDGDTACAPSTATVEIEVCPAPGRGWINADVLDYITNSVTGRRVTDADGIVGQVYWAPVDVFDERLFEPLDVPTPPLSIGIYLSGVLTAPVTPSGARANFQIRFWEAAFGASYAEAIRNRQPRNGRLALVATTDIITSGTGDPAAIPPGFPGDIQVLVAPVLTPVQPPSGPQAVEQTLITGLAQPVAIELRANEAGQDLVFALTSYPLHGELRGPPPYLSYTPRPEFSGVDSFTFVACERGNTNPELEPAMVIITVDKVVHCPKAVVRVLPPALKEAHEETYWIIAPNGRRTLVLFEGTGSYQPGGSALAFSWTMLAEMESNPASGPVNRPITVFTPSPRAPHPAVNTGSLRSPASTRSAGRVNARRPVRTVPLQEEVLFGLGEVAGWPASVGAHRVQLEVSDGSCSSSQIVTIRVLSPVGGILRCMSLIDTTTGAPRSIKRSLRAVLELSAHALDQGQTEMAVRRLRQFLVKLQHLGRSELDPAIGERWANSVEWVIDALQSGE